MCKVLRRVLAHGSHLTTVYKSCLTDLEVDRPQIIPHCGRTVACLSKLLGKDM